MSQNKKNEPILFEYFKESADIILAKYKRSSQQKASDNLGINRELFCSEFLEKILPFRLILEKGEIWDSKGGKTGQLDTIILRDDVPKLEFGDRNAHLIEGVFAVIEIKSNLNSAKLIEAGNSLNKVSKLEIKLPKTQFGAGILFDRPLRFIFAYEGIEWDTLIKTIKKHNWFNLFDLICILNKGVFIKRGNLIRWQTDDDYIIINGKAAALGYLYYYLVIYCQGFSSSRIQLNPYFEPFDAWNEENLP